MAIAMPVSHALAQTEVPLAGPAYKAATEAYSSFDKGDFQHAADKARESIALRPDMLRLQLLLIDALTAAGQLTQAEQEAVKTSQNFKANPDLNSRLVGIRQRMALGTAGDAYKALDAGDAKAAVQSAQRALQYAPNNLSYRLLLLNAQLAAKMPADALSTANDAVALDRGNYVPLVWRAYINQRLGNRQAAMADFQNALAIPGLNETDEKNIRLIAADAALSAGNVAAVVDLLKAYPRTDPSVITRLSDAEGVIAHKGTLDDAKFPPMPGQNCQDGPTGVVCTLQAPAVLSRLVLTPAVTKTDQSSEAANRAYHAERQKDYTTAIAEAREAIEIDPKNAANRLLLVNLLMSAGQAGSAEAEATTAIRLGFVNAELFAQRGFARNQLKNYPGAIADWEAALQRGLPADQSRNVRLSIADAALSAKQPLKALSVLSTLGTSYDTAIRRAYALQALGQKPEALAAFTLAGRMATTSLQQDGALRAQISLLVQLDRKPEARAIFDQALAQGRLRTVAAADMGYLADQVGDEPLAVASFDRAREQHQLAPSAYFDAGYAAKRNFENQKAIAYLATGLDNYYDGRFAFDDQQIFDVRRQVADLSRVWGVNTSVTYGKVGSAFNPFQLPSSSYTTQVGSELYYRPEGFGYRDNSIFEVFARVFQTLADESGGPTGDRTTQAMVGARWKPLSTQNLVFEVDKLFAGGNAARDDTLARVAYSYTYGTDLRVDVPNWLTGVFYGEIDHFFEHTQTVAQADGRLGESLRLDAINRNLVLFPHVVLAASYDDSFANRQAYSAGLGASLRYWFGETKYMAPPSYVELTMQYRFRVAGDSRAEGIFAQALVNY